jgi:hypothetical protein
MCWRHTTTLSWGRRKNRPQFDWDTNELVLAGARVLFTEKKKPSVNIVEVSATAFARLMSKKHQEIGVILTKNKEVFDSIKGEIPPSIQKLLDEFADVFPESLPTGLPMDRGDKNHYIPLVPDAKPSVRTPYRLAPSEMESLKERIKELLILGHIRPSSSP